ncbi:unnamed protein product [Diatraea saccharalis]|uniref:Vitamin K-dependent gamma-carboxylase n=1 Tax=Diatraea saccharalis TaxID=40085 RepID=A0A9N9QWM6_9NEOP|nr:unnamed protein product [Diatraea saccharalis]
MIKKKLTTVLKEIGHKFKEQFGFEIQDVTFSKVVQYLHEPKDASSLAVTRILFGLAMLFDIPDERGGAVMERRWGDITTCHFPLLPFLHPAPLPYMAVVYAAMWIGAVGVMVGYKYTTSSALFTLCFWYLLLIEKSFWNNHSYLFGLVSLLLCFTDAACYWSLDAYFDPLKKKDTVPYWNYFILKYQFFILYFMAGLKKSTAEWLTGYSVQNLSEHWVFTPFRLFLTVPQIDFLVVHWFIFAFDLTVAAWMMWGRTRHVTMIFCALFHLMNSRLFRIGMFPWVCLATMPLFYPFDWPKLTLQFVNTHIRYIKSKLCCNISPYTTQFKCKMDSYDLNAYDECSCSDELLEENISNDSMKETTRKDTEKNEDNIHKSGENNKDLVQAFLDGKECNCDQKDDETDQEQQQSKNSDSVKNFTVLMIMFHIVTQAFLPFSHFITKGYNNWTNGLYGYSWDMMVHTWEPHSIVIKIVDNEKNHEFYIDPHLFAPNERWSRHGDMIYQYAHCLRNNIVQSRKKTDGRISENISIYVDVWCSMNGRFAQRMFDPKVDMLKAKWSPFEPVSYLMPVLDEALNWRTVLDKIREEIHVWNNYSDVSFYADFPGYNQEKFIPKELHNVTLSVLEGIVAYEPEMTELFNGQSIKLETGESVKIKSGTFHKVINIGESYAYYMYTFFNSTEMAVGNVSEAPKPKLPIGAELVRRFNNMIAFVASESYSPDAGSMAYITEIAPFPIGPTDQCNEPMKLVHM